MRRRMLCMAGGLVLFLAGRASAWKAPQDQWVLENHRRWEVIGAQGIAVGSNRVFVTRHSGGTVAVYTKTGEFVQEIGSQGSGPEQFSGPAHLAIHGGELYVADNGNGRVQVLLLDGTFQRTLATGGGWGIAVDDDSVYVTRGSRIQVFSHTGVPQREWGSSGTLPGQFNGALGVAVDAGFVYVADEGNKRVQVFSKQGQFVREWDMLTGNPAGNQGPYGIAVDEANVYVSFGRKTNNYSWLSRLQIYDKSGVLRWDHYTSHVREQPSHNPAWGEPLSYPRGIALDGSLVYVADNGVEDVTIIRRLFRTLGSRSIEENPPPLGSLLLARQRQGTSILDVDYTVADPNDTHVTVYPIAYTNPTPSLAASMPMQTLIEGTDANTGTNIEVGVTHRLSWDVGADWNTAYGDIRIGILARDNRELLDIHWLHMPAVGVNPALKINRYPITENDLLNLWFWVIASGNTTVTLSDGQVHGADGSAYGGELLADDTGTRRRGREFLFSLLGVREATADELQQAREASTPGSVTQWDPRYKLPTGVPKKVNEFGFDTGSTDSDGWWVVKV